MLREVGNSLLDNRLGQGGLQGQQLLSILGAQQGLGGSDGVFQNSASGVQVEGGDALGAGEGGVGQGQQGFNVGLVGGDDLFGGAHVNLLK